MWAHTLECPCSVCKTLPRLFALIRVGNCHPPFVPWLGDRLRLLEGEVRDELQRLGPPPSLPSAPVAPATAEPGRESAGPATAPPPNEENAKKEEDLQLCAKGKPIEPPKSLVPPAPAATGVKEEPPTSPHTKDLGVIEVDAGATSSHRSAKSPSRGRRRRERSEERDRPRRERRSEGGRKSKRRSRSSPRRYSSRRRHSSPRGRSKKRRTERPPEPEGPPPRRGGRPPEPPYPPPGRGWQGVLPRSDHPRWSQGTNKGQVKRAKQERFNRRGRRYK